jgi:hypothetical protein
MVNSYKERNPDTSLDNFESPKAFIWMIAHAINSKYGDPKACLTTVRQYWKNTTASLSWTGHPVQSEIISSTTHISHCAITPY